MVACVSTSDPKSCILRVSDSVPGSPSARSHEISASRSLFSPLFLFFSLLRNSIRISQTSGAGGLPSRSTEKFCLSLPLLLDPVYPASLDLITSREPPLSKTISQKMFMFPPKHFLFSSFEINAQPFSLFAKSLCHSECSRV